MVDQQGESVTSNDAQSVAGITADQLNQPHNPEQSQDVEKLRQKAALANKHAKEAERKTAEAERRLAEVEAQFKALADQVQQTNTASLQEQGKYKELWDKSQKTILGLKAELEAERKDKQSVAAEFEQERLKVQALGVLDQAGALSPEQLFALLQAQHGFRKGEEGQVEVVVGGASIPLNDHLANLRNTSESGYQHHFSASGARGMGATASSTVAPGMKNPFRQESFNFTEQLMLKTQNPELAAALEAEAGRG